MWGGAGTGLWRFSVSAPSRLCVCVCVCVCMCVCVRVLRGSAEKGQWGCYTACTLLLLGSQMALYVPQLRHTSIRPETGQRAIRPGSRTLLSVSCACAFSVRFRHGPKLSSFGRLDLGRVRATESETAGSTQPFCVGCARVCEQ